MSNRLVVISGPSGAGKTELFHELERRINARKVISCTTREPRAGEIDGKDYRFLARGEFTERISRG